MQIAVLQAGQCVVGVPSVCFDVLLAEMFATDPRNLEQWPSGQ